MGGGVNPFEWLFAPVALSHLAIDQAVKAGGGEGVTAPGSPDAKAKADAQEQQRLGDIQQQNAATEAERIRYNTTPQTAAEEFLSRKRAQEARSALGKSSRAVPASEYMTTLG